MKMFFFLLFLQFEGFQLVFVELPKFKKKEEVSKKGMRMEEEIKEERATIAAKLKQMRVPMEKITETTGLSKEEFLSL
mgnify:CR=1 FL=1